ncbi:DUF1304 domain-containing protein [Erysipelothrix sp. HDW6C]|uniref:DUF1304 domain-containing protein n=1 Tax=Erysipelothrix sp. HDW6C TaxID=2714930 RepID=UPI001408C623|nr:DUF1304 domain-containing protein [Erysipelothrix sp. HDW6C]QIK69209.1 DUF1304 domain-containing protein [Erysipelothrix sp. HDW6C]
MSFISSLLIVFVAIEFFFIMYLETFATTSKQTSKVFNLNDATIAHPSIQVLLKNQGVYNGLIGVFLLYALFFSGSALEISRLVLVYIICVATYGSFTSNKKIILTQGGLAIIALLSTFIF